MTRVLLTDAQPRMTLAVTRSLGRKGIEIIGAEETRFAPALFSKYCSRSLLCPNPKTDKTAYFQWLVETIKGQACDILFPIDDPSLEIAVEHRDELESLCQVPLPPTESYRITADKALTVEMAQKAGLLCPETITPHNLEELADLAERLEYPVVIKPRKSSGSRGITFVKDKTELQSFYLSVHEDYPYPLIQRYIPPGEKYSVCLLFNKDSQLRASFVQKQVRHYPVDIGTSVVQESVFFPELIEAALLFMQKVKWFGVVEFEFLVGKADKKAYFMEINPRFWGSVHMSILAGVDFPWLLYRLLTEGDIEKVTDYQTGIFCRWLLPGDILHFLTNKQRGKMEPPFLAGKKHNTYDDTISLADPLPTLGFFLACLRYFFDIEKWRFVLKGDYFAKRPDR